jgi:pentatricopeptide repeat protein
VDKGRKHWNYLDECSRKVCNQTLFPSVGVLNACGNVVAIEKGKCTREQIVQSGWDLDIFVGSSSVDMYAKCGSMEDACKVFNKILSHDVGNLDLHA